MVHKIVISILVLVNIFIYFFAKNYIQPVKADVELCGEAGRVNRINLGIEYYDCEDELPEIPQKVENTVTFVEGIPQLYDKENNLIEFDQDGYPLGVVDYTNVADPQAFTEDGKPVVIYGIDALYIVTGGGIVEDGIPAKLSDVVVVGANACTTPLMPNIIETQKLADVINEYIKSKNPGSPFVGFGSDFVQAGMDYQVNPLLIVAHAFIETNFGQAGSGISNGSHNAFGRTAGEGQPSAGGFYKYDSFQESLYQQAYYMKKKYIDIGLSSLELYLKEYAEGWREYIPKATKVMNEVAKNAEMTCDD
ncbi:glucosaminidase domain-containing protein [Candidatus Saccharibacteria bacterium]|nr:glucosaminidase domain-containing protein [Candidatus Saccharibacteria bacterium]MCB9834654.1 glucosaminidase domain-containing protein [Candidatus Nomurabacteria bacterium]